MATIFQEFTNKYLPEGVSYVAALGALGFLTKQVCDHKFSKIEDGRTVNAHPYVTLALRTAAFVGDFNLFVFSLPTFLIEVGSSFLLHKGWDIVVGMQPWIEESKKATDALEKETFPPELETGEVREKVRQVFPRICYLLTPPEKRANLPEFMKDKLVGPKHINLELKAQQLVTGTFINFISLSRFETQEDASVAELSLLRRIGRSVKRAGIGVITSIREMDKSLSNIVALGFFGFVAKQICESKFSHVEETEKVNTHPYITTVLKVIALVGDIALCTCFFPFFLIAEVGLSAFLHMGVKYQELTKAAWDAAGEEKFPAILVNNDDAHKIFARVCYLLTPPEKRQLLPEAFVQHRLGEERLEKMAIELASGAFAYFMTPDSLERITDQIDSEAELKATVQFIRSGGFSGMGQSQRMESSLAS